MKKIDVLDIIAKRESRIKIKASIISIILVLLGIIYIILREIL